MERIVITVDDVTAKKWRLASEEKRNRISQKIDVKLAKELMQDSKEEFKQFIDRLGKTMEDRGLTEEILQDILNEDD